MIFDSCDIVILPFPLTDRLSLKRRPALVLSAGAAFNSPAGQVVLAMIVSSGNAPMPLDVPITERASTGLKAEAVVRMKLFTVDRRNIVRKTGRLSAKDAHAVQTALAELLAL